MKKKTISVLAIFLVVGSVITFLFVRGDHISSLSINELSINNVSLSNNELALSGSLLSSGKSYRSYSYDISGSDIYITINGGIVTKKYPYGDFDFTIKDNNLQKVDIVYLKHKNKLTQIYPR